VVDASISLVLTVLDLWVFYSWLMPIVAATSPGDMAPLGPLPRFDLPSQLRGLCGRRSQWQDPRQSRYRWRLGSFSGTFFCPLGFRILTANGDLNVWFLSFHNDVNMEAVSLDS
jgi:hypothetical protein